MHGTAASVAVVQLGTVRAAGVNLDHNGGAASAAGHGRVVCLTKIYGCTPKGYVSNCSLAAVWQKLGGCQRATVKRQPLRCNKCCENNFCQQIGQQQASTVACRGLTAAPNCHLPYCSSCLLPVLGFFSGQPLASPNLSKPSTWLDNTRKPQAKLAVARCTAVGWCLLGRGISGSERPAIYSLTCDIPFLPQYVSTATPQQKLFLMGGG